MKGQVNINNQLSAIESGGGQRKRLLHFRRTKVAPLVRKVFKSGRLYFKADPSRPSQLPVDIVIPTAPKDFPVLAECINGLRKNLLHPINNISLLAPRDARILQVCEDHSCRFVDEREILPQGPGHYHEIFKNVSLRRSGWIYQQFLKLSVGQKLGLDYFLVYDSDTVLINPFKYEFGGRVILEFSDGYREDLDSLHCRLLPSVPLQPYSFMCHAMLMNTGVIEKMLSSIEKTTGKEWREGIIDAIDMSQDLCFSEYEILGNFSCENPADGRRNRLVYWFNKALKRQEIEYADERIKLYAGRYRTLSFHSYAR